MLKIEGLRKSYEKQAGWRARRGVSPVKSVFAVNDISLDVSDGEMFTLLGPSGCGKTTTLRSIAGLETPSSGRIVLDGRVIFSNLDGERANVPANERGLGMVFQSYAIWPHMTVFENVAFPLSIMGRRRRPGRLEIRERVERVLSTMELGEYAGRPATNLSGGQQQRLALARAIVVEPPLLLLDEPLSNLDAKLRESLRLELKRLQREMGITSIYVTHDQIEALAISSTIAVMDHGEVAQVGKPRDIYERPANRFVAEFIGTSNFIGGTVVKKREGTTVVETASGLLSLGARDDVAVGDSVLVSIRPETIGIAPATSPSPAEGAWRGTVVNRAFLGDTIDHIVAVGDREFRVRGNPSISIAQGSVVSLTFSPESFSLVPA